jgi:hypothetical protein
MGKANIFILMEIDMRDNSKKIKSKNNDSKFYK